MSEKVIGFDLDGVLLDLDSVKVAWLQERYAGTEAGERLLYMTGFGYEGPLHWEYEKSLGISTEVVGEFWKAVPKLAARPFSGSRFYLDRFKKADWKVHIVSHRTPGSPFAGRGKRDVENWFGDSYDSLTFVASTDGKIPVLKELGVVGYVDDKWETAWKIGSEDWEVSPVERGRIKSFLLHRPYNASMDLEAPYKRICSLEEYCQEFGV